MKGWHVATHIKEAITVFNEFNEFVAKVQPDAFELLQMLKYISYVIILFLPIVYVLEPSRREGG